MAAPSASWPVLLGPFERETWSEPCVPREEEADSGFPGPQEHESQVASVTSSLPLCTHTALVGGSQKMGLDRGKVI